MKVSLTRAYQLLEDIESDVEFLSSYLKRMNKSPLTFSAKEEDLNMGHISPKTINVESIMSDQHVPISKLSNENCKSVTTNELNKLAVSITDYSNLKYIVDHALSMNHVAGSYSLDCEEREFSLTELFALRDGYHEMIQVLAPLTSFFNVGEKTVAANELDVEDRDVEVVSDYRRFADDAIIIKSYDSEMINNDLMFYNEMLDKVNLAIVSKTNELSVEVPDSIVEGNCIVTSDSDRA